MVTCYHLIIIGLPEPWLNWLRPEELHLHSESLDWRIPVHKQKTTEASPSEKWSLLSQPLDWRIPVHKQETTEASPSEK